MRTTNVYGAQVPQFQAVPFSTTSHTQNNIQPAQPLKMQTHQIGQDKDQDIDHEMQPSTPDSTAQRADLYDADGDGVADDELFEGSTHHFAIYFSSKRNVSGLIIAYFVFSLQMTLYLICAHQVMGDLSGDQFTIPVQVRYGQQCSEPKNLVCPPDLPNLWFVALAAVLLALFLMHDIVAGIRVITTIPGIWAKLAGFIIIFEALFAALIGGLFAVGAEDGYDAIANCIGVLFIHDADEKAFEAFQVINARQLQQGKCCKNRCCDTCCSGKIMSKLCGYTKLAALFITTFVIMVLALLIAGVIRAAQKEQIIKIYGDDYYDNKFGSGWSYDWDWDSSSNYTWGYY